MYRQIVFRLLLVHLSIFEAVFAVPNVTFIAIGDWGERALPGQDLVAEAMSVWAEVNYPEFILTVGDNFYPNGVSSVDAPGWDTKWRDVYVQDSIKDLPWYITVGNHDSNDNGDEWVQVEYTALEPRWIYPHIWHSFHRSVGEKDIHFINFETESFRGERNNHTIMQEWFEDELAASESDWKIVWGHRHIYSSGDYGPIDSRNYNYIRPLLEEHEVDIYLCGHDHSLQHMQNIQDIDVDYIVSAGGGSLPYPYDPEAESDLNEIYGVNVNHFDAVWGFAGFIITEDEIYVEFIDTDGERLYSYTRSHPVK